MKRVALLVAIFAFLFPILVWGQSRVYTVKPGDTLWKIAATKYNNGWLWPVIYRANPGIKNPSKIFPGQELMIPNIPKEQLGLTLPKLDGKIRRVEARQAGDFTFLALKLAILSNRVDGIEKELKKQSRPQPQTQIRVRTQTQFLPSKNKPQAKKLSGRVWVDGAWCLSQAPGGYGAREVGAGFQIGRFSVYSGTPRLSGLAVTKIQLPGVKVGGLKIFPLLTGGFQSVNLNVGRDIIQQTSLLTNAKPFGGIGLSLNLHLGKISTSVDWYGFANNIKAEKFWDPYQFRRLEGVLKLDLIRSISLIVSGVSQKSFLPEWQAMVTFPAGSYRLGVGYGYQNPYQERRSRGMLVSRVEYRF